MTASAEPSTELQRDFHRAMLGVYRQARGLGYNATRFLQMVEELGGVQAAKLLLAKPGLQTGLEWLWEHHKLDISMEALVLQERFRPLFSEGEIREARQRLADLDYHPPN
jgi:hypothetical protein